MLFIGRDNSMENDTGIILPTKKTIILNGPLTIQKIGEGKKIISPNHFLYYTEITIDHSDSGEFDFSYLQLLYSAYITLQGRNLNLSIASNSSVLFNQLYKESGFDSTDLAEILQLQKNSAEGSI